MTETRDHKSVSDNRRKLFRRLRADFAFSGESLRINAWGLLFGLAVGILVGLSGGLFVRLLQFAQTVREGTAWAVWLLPFAGLPVVWMYRRGGIKTAGGTNLIVEAARGEQPVSRLLAPVIFVSTVLTHMFGGSAGREGAALQMGGSLAVLVRKWFRMEEEFEDLAIMCGMSAGFSAVFGGQISAAVFALEISCVGVLPLGALFPCVVSSLTAGTIARAIGGQAVTFSLPSVAATPLFYGRVLVLSLVCGLLSIVVCYTFSGVRKLLAALFANEYLRAFAGGAAVVALTALVGTKAYLGSGQVLIAQAIDQGSCPPESFLLKLLFTALTLGAGFKGGEILPAFSVGAAFGCVVGPLVGLPASWGAAIGMIALFCGVTNCPFTSLMLGFEVFSFWNPGGFLVAVAASFLVSGYGGLYSKQKFAFSKNIAPNTSDQREENPRQDRMA